MNINTISYWIAEAVASIIKNQKIFLSGIAVMIVTLLCISLLFFAYIAGDGIMAQVQDSQGKIEVFLNDDVTEEEMDNIGNRIMLINGVKSIEIISKEESKIRAEESMKGMTEGLPQDFFPASIIITLDNLEKAKEVALIVRGIEGVGEKDDDISVNENSEFIGKVAITIKIIAATIFILASVAACFIMINSIKLMLYSRKKEISIMKYVGATDTFTKAPFIIEGLIISLISALVVLIIVGIFANGLSNVANNLKIFNFLVITKDNMSTLTFLLLGLAIGIGTVGSSISINKYLDV